MYAFFTSGATLLAYAVAAFAVPQRADLPPVVVPVVPSPPGFNMSVSPAFFLLISTNVALVRAWVSTAPVALLDRPIMPLMVKF